MPDQTAPEPDLALGIFLEIARQLQSLSPEQRRRVIRALIALYEIDVLPIPG